MGRLDTFQRTALLTTAATYLLIAVGGLVRAAGAGLGCPDWPRCFDRWVPPTSVDQVPAHIDPALFNVAKAWTEYANRLLGVLVGFLIFATLVLAIRRYRHHPRVLWPTVAAFLGVGFEGWLGGQVVFAKLSPIVLTAHLTLALVIVSLLVYATVSAFFPADTTPSAKTDGRRRLGRATLAVSALVLLQVGLGALVRGEVQILGQAGLPRAEWVDALGSIDIYHRQLALLVTAAVTGLVYWVYQDPDRDPWLRGAAVFVGACVALQVGAGLGLAYAGFPAALQVAHLWLAAATLGGLTVLCMLAYRLDPRLAPGRPAEAVA